MKLLLWIKGVRVESNITTVELIQTCKAHIPGFKPPSDNYFRTHNHRLRLCPVGECDVQTYQITRMNERATHFKQPLQPQLGMSRCYGLPFFKNIALGGLCKTHNLL